MTMSFPGNFNMSFTEHHWLKEYQRYVDWDHDYVILTAQSCIRLNDFDLLETRNGWNYLGVFEMADMSGEIAVSEVPEYLLRSDVTVMAFYHLELALGIMVAQPMQRIVDTRNVDPTNLHCLEHILHGVGWLALVMALRQHAAMKRRVNRCGRAPLHRRRDRVCRLLPQHLQLFYWGFLHAGSNQLPPRGL